MDNHNSPVGIFSVILSIFAAALSVASLQIWISLVAGIVAIISGIMAIRYYYHKTEEVIKTKKDVE